MKFVVKRSEWYRGKGSSRESKLAEIFNKNGDEIVFID